MQTRPTKPKPRNGTNFYLNDASLEVVDLAWHHYKKQTLSDVSRSAFVTVLARHYNETNSITA